MHLFTTYLSTFYAAMYVLLDITTSPSGRPCTLLPSRLDSVVFCDRLSFAEDICQQNTVQYRTKLLLKNISLAESFLCMYLSSTLSLSPSPSPSLSLSPSSLPLSLFPSHLSSFRLATHSGTGEEEGEEAEGLWSISRRPQCAREPQHLTAAMYLLFLLYYLFYLF